MMARSAVGLSAEENDCSISHHESRCANSSSLCTREKNEVQLSDIDDGERRNETKNGRLFSIIGEELKPSNFLEGYLSKRCGFEWGI